ncbi:unknown [Bacteroides sp. CAG:462]|nr:unknown [Bacteroides sp. CAG:462]
MLATMPGMRPYMAHMYTIRRIRATMKEMTPWLMDSCPSDGPTMSSCTMCAGAGILPELSTLARSLVSSREKLPVIWDCPPVISFITFGAL